MPAPAASMSPPTPAARPMFRPVNGRVFEPADLALPVVALPVLGVVVVADAAVVPVVPLELEGVVVGLDEGVVVLELW